MRNAALKRRVFVGMLGSLLITLTSCQSDAPPPARVPVHTDPNAGPARMHPQPKPIYIDRAESELPMPIDDPPLITQAPPEQASYLESYELAGRPRVVVFVNRTIEGNIVNTAEFQQVSSSGSDTLPNSPDGQIYLAPGKYDEVQARALDYEAMELVMGDLLAANGRVKLISPSMARTRLTDAQIKQIQSGEPTALRVVAQTLGTDVLVQVQARPTKQTRDGLSVRVLAEAIDVADGRSLARAFVDVPPPLTKSTLQKYSRYLSRKLMYNLAGTWKYGTKPIEISRDPVPHTPPMPDPTARPPTPQPIPDPPPTPKDAPPPPPAPKNPAPPEPDQPPTPKN